jgi:hypothetical protein
MNLSQFYSESLKNIAIFTNVPGKGLEQSMMRQYGRLLIHSEKITLVPNLCSILL